MAGSLFGTTAAAADPAPEENEEEAAEESDDGLDIGGYGGLGVRYARVIERNTAMACVEFALIFDKVFSVGPGGCSTWVGADATTEEVNATVVFLNFAGTTFRYHLRPEETFDFSLGLTAGAGSIEIQDDELESVHTDSLIVVEPVVGVHTFVADWMRVSAEGAYRVVSGVDTGGVTSGDVSGFSVGVNAHFGWF